MKEVPTQTAELPSPNPDMVWTKVTSKLEEFKLELISEVELTDFCKNLGLSGKFQNRIQDQKTAWNNLPCG